MNSTEKQPASRRPIKIGDAINLALEMAENNQNPTYGIPSGLPSLDRLTRGWREGELIIIGARPTNGKSALALTMARNAAVDFDVPTAYFSMEISVTQLTDRLIVSESGVPMEKLRGMDKMEEPDWQQVEASVSKLAKAPLYIDDSLGIIMGELRERIKDLVLHHGVKLIFIDCFQLLLPDAPRSSSSYRKERKEELCLIKEMALEFKVPIIVLSQVGKPKRRNYYGPVYAELDTLCPYADEYADKIILLHRPGMFGIDPDFSEDGTDSLRLFLIKNNSGSTGIIDFRFDRNRLRVTDPEEDRFGSVMSYSFDDSEADPF